MFGVSWMRFLFSPKDKYTEKPFKDRWNEMESKNKDKKNCFGALKQRAIKLSNIHSIWDQLHYISSLWRDRNCDKYIDVSVQMWFALGSRRRESRELWQEKWRSERKLRVCIYARYAHLYYCDDDDDDDGELSVLCTIFYLFSYITQ